MPVEPTTDKNAEQRRDHDRPPKRADHRQVLAERPFALALPTFPPLLPRPDGVSELVVVVRRQRHCRSRRAAPRRDRRDRRRPLGLQEAVDLPDRRQIETLRIGARRPFVLDARRNGASTSDLEAVQIVTGDGLAGRDRDRVAATHVEHAATHGDVMLGPGSVAPGHHRYGERGQEVGMARQDAERAGLVLGAQMRDIIGSRRRWRAAW